MTADLEPSVFSLRWGSAAGEVQLHWDAGARRFSDPNRVWSERVHYHAPPREALEGLALSERIQLLYRPPYGAVIFHARPAAEAWRAFWRAVGRTNIWLWQGADFGQGAVGAADCGWALTIRQGERLLDVAGVEYPGNWVFFEYHLYTLLGRQEWFRERRRTAQAPQTCCGQGTVIASHYAWRSAGGPRRQRLDAYDEAQERGFSTIVYSMRGSSVCFAQEEGKALQIRQVRGELADFEKTDESASWSRFEHLLDATPVSSFGVAVALPEDSVLQRVAEWLTDEHRAVAHHELLAGVMKLLRAHGRT
jgi:hypothetical protein